MVGIGVTLLDFSADSCDSPLRAYLLDVCSTKDQETGLNIHAFLGGKKSYLIYTSKSKILFIFFIEGIGASLGYVLAALIHNEQTLYYISAISFIICLLMTMTSAKEKPFRKKTKEIQIKDNSNLD